MNRDLKKTASKISDGFKLIVILACINACKSHPDNSQIKESEWIDPIPGQITSSAYGSDTNHSFLMLRDGSLIASSEKEKSPPDSSKVKAKQAVLYYEAEINEKLEILKVGIDFSEGESSKYKTVIAARRGFHQVIMPDGSFVWLDARSVLRIPNFSPDSAYRVQLTGHAYFEVNGTATKGRRLKPLYIDIINNKTVQCTVISSDAKLDIECHPDDSLIAFTLASGTGKLNYVDDGEWKEADLDRGTKSRFISFSNRKIYSLRGVRNKYEDSAIVAAASSWIKGYYVFTNESIENIMKVCQLRYGVNIVFISPTNYRFTGTISIKKSFSEFLQYLTNSGRVFFLFDTKKNELKVLVK